MIFVAPALPRENALNEEIQPRVLSSRENLSPDWSEDDEVADEVADALSPPMDVGEQVNRPESREVSELQQVTARQQDIYTAYNMSEGQLVSGRYFFMPDGPSTRSGTGFAPVHAAYLTNVRGRARDLRREAHVLETLLHERDQGDSISGDDLEMDEADW